MAGSTNPAPDTAERRKSSAKRHLLRLTGSLVSVEQDTGGASGKATIRNISPTGVLLESDKPLLMDQTIHIDLGAAGRQSAQVRWVDGKLAGCEFSSPIGKARVSAALLQADHAPARESSPRQHSAPPLMQTLQGRNLGLAIAWARKARGMNQSELARALGVSTTSICKWENAHARPRAEAFARLQDVLQGEASWPPVSSSHPVEDHPPAARTIRDLTTDFKADLSHLLCLDVSEIEIQITIRNSPSGEKTGNRLLPG